MDEQKQRAYRWIVILAILAYIAISFLPCTMTVDINSVQENNQTAIDTANNISPFMLLMLGAQILLLLWNRSRWQLLAGILGALPGAWNPFKIACERAVRGLLSNVYTFVWDPRLDGPSTETELLPGGWLVFGLSLALIVMDIWAAKALQKRKTVPANVAEEGDGDNI